MPTLVESITKLHFPNKTVRVWCQEKEDYEHYTEERERRHALFDRISPISNYPIRKLADEILKLDDVSAVEVIDIFDDGIVLYRDWP